MRHISLLNRSGEEIDLTNDNIFFNGPKGFGYTIETNYRMVGNRWVPVKNNLSQTPIKGSVVFTDPNAYYDYFKFVRFCNNSPLTFVYTTDDTNDDTIENTTYYKRVLCSSIDKGEKDSEYGILEIDIEFTPLTPWYKEEIIDVPVELDAEGWVWSDDNRTQPFWGMTWTDSEKMTAILTIDSTMDCPTKLKIYGPITNPSWDVYANGSKISSGGVTCYVADGNYLSIDCTKDPYEMKIYAVEGDEFLSDVYQNADFSTQRFVWLNKGKNSVSVHSDDDVNVHITLEANIYYESV